VTIPAYTSRTVRRYYYRPLLLASLCAQLFWSAASAAENRSVTIDPALARGAADAPVTIVEFSDYQ
jgi:hypothetical protein